MRVLHVINSLSASGGAENGLVREIVRFSSDVEQIVVRLFGSDRLDTAVRQAGIQSLSLNLDSDSSGWNWPAGVIRLDGTIRRLRPDILHSSLASANLVAQLAALRHGLPVLSTFTLSGDPQLMRSYQPGAHLRRAEIMRRIERMSSRMGHVWFRALTEDAKTTNCETAGLDPDRVVVIPRGVPLPDLSEPRPTRAMLGLPEQKTLILNVGRQTAQKGQTQLVEAFARLRQRKEAHLVILGREGDETGALNQAIAATGVGESVTVIPYTDSPYDYYQAADVFVFTSLMEGLGTAVLEAMANGLPVVAYDIAPVREITDGSRLAAMVPVGDVAALTERVEQLVDDPQAAHEVALAARENVAAHYSIDVVARRLQSHLRALSRREFG